MGFCDIDLVLLSILGMMVTNAIMLYKVGKHEGNFFILENLSYFLYQQESFP